MKELEKLRELTAFQYWLGTNYNTLPTDSGEMTKRANLYNKIIDSDMKLTKKFIKENAGMTLKEAFPEVFGCVLEVGKWYKVNTVHDYLLMFSGNKQEVSLGFANGEWENWSFSKKANQLNCIPATPQEIKNALEKEAVRRYPDECTVEDLTGQIKKLYSKRHYDYYFEENTLYLYGWEIFHNGIWATIIPTITKQEAEERLGMKII